MTVSKFLTPVFGEYRKLKSHHISSPSFRNPMYSFYKERRHGDSDGESQPYHGYITEDSSGFYITENQFYYYVRNN